MRWSQLGSFPANLRASQWITPEWLAALPATVERLATHWDLTLGAPFESGGYNSWVAPARTGDGADVVCKVGLVFPESEAEAQGLRDWNGNGVVRLLDELRSGNELALLLERVMPGERLKLRPEPEQDEVIADIVKRLHRFTPDPARYPTLSDMAVQWVDECEPATGAGALDPKPHIGDPTYEPIQHMFNCQRLIDDPDTLITRIADLFELDRERLRLWTFARCVEIAPRWTHLKPIAQHLAP